MVFERCKFARNFWNANRAATHVTPLIATSLFPVSAPGGVFDSRLKSDPFVMGYIYGVLMAVEGADDRHEKGLFIQQVFEQLFLKQGRPLTEYCNAQALRKNPDFIQATRVGFEEMIELVNSGGHKPLDSLLNVIDHLKT
jgi:hypothetical protein